MDDTDEIYSIKLKRSFKIMLFILLLISPISTLLSPFEPSQLSLAITWLHNALMYAGISLFGLYIGKWIRMEGLWGRLLSSVVVPVLVGNLVFNLLVFILLLLVSYQPQASGIYLLILAFLTLLLLEVIGIIRLYFDSKISKRLGYAQIKTSKRSFILLATIFGVSVLLTNDMLGLGDLITTLYGSAISTLLQTYIDSIPGIGILILLFPIVWYLDGELELLK